MPSPRSYAKPSTDPSFTTTYTFLGVGRRMWEDRGQRGQGHLPRKARAGCEPRYPQTTWFRPDPPSASLPANSSRIHTCLPKLHVHWLPSRHHISLHYAQCPENPPMKREDTSVYVSPAPLATSTFCLHCACTPGISSLGVTNISGASCPPLTPAQN